MDDMILVSLFVMGLLGTAWYTVYAFAEYQAERIEEMDESIDEVLWGEVFRQYLRPLFWSKLRGWDPLSADSPVAGHRTTTLEARAVLLFVDVRRSLLLDPEELHIFTTLCVDALKRRYRFHTRRYIQRRLEETCNQYVWHMNFLDEMLEQIIEWHKE